MASMNAKPVPDYEGKVRDLYFINETEMIICATDRISAFDVVFNETIPGKGVILNHISQMWFNAIKKSGLPKDLEFCDQLISSNPGDYPGIFTNQPFLKNRSILVKRTKRIDFECVVRGYLAGSGWKEYQKSGTVCGEILPANLKEAQKLPEAIFTPATKAARGEHDENVSFSFMQNTIGNKLADRLKTISLAIYNFAADKMQEAGYILCDTKFEFGLIGDNIILIDEALTPDSSRYWKQSDYKPGKTPPGYDKQYIRDYVSSLGWNKKPPAPPLPDDIIKKTRQLYIEIDNRIQEILET